MRASDLISPIIAIIFATRSYLIDFGSQYSYRNFECGETCTMEKRIVPRRETRTNRGGARHEQASRVEWSRCGSSRRHLRAIFPQTLPPGHRNWTLRKEWGSEGVIFFPPCPRKQTKSIVRRSKDRTVEGRKKGSTSRMIDIKLLYWNPNVCDVIVCVVCFIEWS